MTDFERARELERRMRAYGGDVLRLCYVCPRDGDAGHGPLRAVLALLILSPQRVFTCEMLLCAISLLTESAFGDRI